MPQLLDLLPGQLGWYDVTHQARMGSNVVEHCLCNNSFGTVNRRDVYQAKFVYKQNLEARIGFGQLEAAISLISLVVRLSCR
jgi:hypothetical protein